VTILECIGEFGRLLRDNGLSTSTVEIMDACAAAEVVGFESRDELRVALRATLVKRLGDEEVFDELFELYFGGRRWTGAVSPVATLPRELVDFVAERLDDALASGPIARRLLGVGGVAATRAISEAAAEAGVGSISSPLQVGFYSYRVGQLLDLDGVAAAVWAAADQATPEVAAVVRERVRANLEELRETIRGFVREEFERRNVGFRERLAARALSEQNLSTLSPRDAQLLRGEVFRLARMLRARLAHPVTVERKGRLDLSRMLRKACAADGIPYSIVLRKRHRKKPRVVVLCDVSDSVRNVSLFMLQFVYALHDCFEKVDSFAFVAELGSTTELFRENDLERALASIASGDVVSLFASSNYGAVLRAFADEHLGRVSSRTTVLIIGDGRNNYNDPALEALEAIAERARRVLWLSPEPEPLWGFGDSVMSEYARSCDAVLVAQSLASLRRVIDELATGQ
jgi:uncharacterized protein with von Willebrand factor type A (vWA) domain